MLRALPPAQGIPVALHFSLRLAIVVIAVALPAIGVASGQERDPRFQPMPVVAAVPESRPSVTESIAVPEGVPPGNNTGINNNAGATGTCCFTQSETTVIAFGSTVIVGFNDSGSLNSGASKFTGWAYSTDDGATFTDGGTLPTNANGDAGDPILARDNTTGRIYFATLQFTGSGILVFRSDDGGLTWQAPTQGAPGKSGDQDKPWMAVDNFAGPGNGNVYLVERDFGAGDGIYLFRSTDGGATFGPSGGNPITSGGQGAYVVVGPDHAVYAFWYAGPTLKVRKSTDGGLTFSPAFTVASGLIGGTNGDLGLTGIRQGMPFASGFRTSEFPHVALNPVSGNLYVTYDNKGAGADKADVFLVQSTDGGATWSAPVKVNDDATTTDQWQPTIVVSGDGTRLGIFYYSRQEDPANNNLFKYYGRVATVSGLTLTFTPSFAVSDTPSLPEFGRDDVVNSVYMGDYNTAAATPGFFHVTWSDNRDDLAGGGGPKDPQVYYAKISLDGSNMQFTKTTTTTSYDHVGQIVDYLVSVTNTGAVTLKNVTLTDPILVWTCTVNSLGPGGSFSCAMQYVVTQADLDAGSFTNTATATADVPQGPPISQSATVTVPAIQRPALTLTKAANPTTFSADGQLIAYSYVVMNSGNVTLSGPLAVADSLITVTCPAVASMPPGATATCTGTYMTTLADVTAKSVANTAKATALFGQAAVTSNIAQATITFVRAMSTDTAKASLLMFTDIDVRPGRTTFVRITNDGDVPAYVKCIWQDYQKNRSDFVFLLTPHQPVVFDAASGDGTAHVNPFPEDGYHAGELVCFAVDLTDRPIAHNHLVGGATVLDFENGTAYAYSAAGFYNRGGSQAGVLKLDGQTAYDLCPKYLIGQFTPSVTTVSSSRGDVAFLQNRLAIASCTQDLRQDFVPVTTKLQFDVWNGDEVKFTGAYECADSWHEIVFGARPLWKGAQWRNFTATTLRTASASYRVQGVVSAQCDNLAPWNVKTQRVGLVGVQSTIINVSGTLTVIASPLAVAGTTPGTISYDPGTAAAEKR